MGGSRRRGGGGRGEVRARHGRAGRGAGRTAARRASSCSSPTAGTSTCRRSSTTTGCARTASSRRLAGHRHRARHPPGQEAHRDARSPTRALRDVIDQMKSLNISQLPVVDKGKMRGIVAEVDLLRALVSRRQDARVAHRRGGRGRLRDRDAAHEDRAAPGRARRRQGRHRRGATAHIVGIVTKIDLIDFLAKHTTPPQPSAPPPAS